MRQNFTISFDTNDRKVVESLLSRSDELRDFFAIARERQKSFKDSSTIPGFGEGKVSFDLLPQSNRVTTIYVGDQKFLYLITELESNTTSYMLLFL